MIAFALCMYPHASLGASGTVHIRQVPNTTKTRRTSGDLLLDRMWRRSGVGQASVPVHELQVPAGHASITTTQRYMNARASSLAESMRQARARRVKRIDEGGDEATAQIG
jgi:hypothetical protein